MHEGKLIGFRTSENSGKSTVFPAAPSSNEKEKMWSEA